jgi:hypothetical protein
VVAVWPEAEELRATLTSRPSASLIGPETAARIAADLAGRTKPEVR